MQIILANVSGPIRRQTANGREYYVVPMSLINPGVLNGSQGALYYPPEECALNSSAWDYTPITINHPVNPLTNEPVSAADPEVLQNQGIGYLRQPLFNRKLLAQGWIDV